MNRPEPEEIHMQAALYLLRELADDDSSAWEARLARGDEQAHRATARMQELAGQLLDAIPPASPQPSTRERLLARVAQTPTRSDQRVGYRQEESWKSTGLPGISIRSLSIDRDLGREMFLLRMEPGAVLPDHRHSQAEECFVLSGTIQTRGLTLSAGDFLRLEAGSQHGDSVTPAGCVVLISAGLAEDVH